MRFIKLLLPVIKTMPPFMMNSMLSPGTKSLIMEIHVLYFFPGMAHSVELAFTVEPNDEVATPGQSVTLMCSADGVQPIIITWRKNGVPLWTGPNAFPLSNGSLYLPFFTNNKDDGLSDQGEYDCVAQNRFGSVVSRKARVQAAGEL